MIQDPGLLDVVCDGCGTSDEIVATTYKPFPVSMPWFRTFGADPATLQSEGWLAEGERVFCPRCANIREG